MPKYARRHYEDVAKIIQKEIKSIQESDSRVWVAKYEAVSNIAVSFSKLFADDNPNFDVKKFNKACGYSS